VENGDLTTKIGDFIGFIADDSNVDAHNLVN
jgi:hypothetical protein